MDHVGLSPRAPKMEAHFVELSHVLDREFNVLHGGQMPKFEDRTDN